MKDHPTLYLTLAVLLFCGGRLTAESPKSQKRLKISAEIEASGQRRIILCCTPSEQFGAKQGCAYEWKGSANVDAQDVSVKTLCETVKKEAAVVSQNGEWYLSRKFQPHQPLFLINCNTSLAWPQEPPASSPPTAAPPASGKDPSPSPPDPQASSGKAEEKVSKRLREVEEALSQQEKALLELEKKLDKRIEALQKELFDKVRALEEGQKNSCFRVDGQYQGQDEVTVAVAGSVLRFLKVKPRETPVPIGLSEAKAGEFLAEAQAQESRPIFPHVYLAVPEAFREVQPFFLQDRLIDPQLYSRLSGGKDAGRVSHQDATRFIAALNSRCTGRARFTLPSEEQLVAAAHRIYDPVANGLKPCEALRKEDLRSGITELFGHSWQLTRSPCQPFGEALKESCPESSYVRKGGATSSTNPLECLPEYRSPAPNDVSQQETSFRLALVE